MLEAYFSTELKFGHLLLFWRTGELRLKQKSKPTLFLNFSFKIWQNVTKKKQKIKNCETLVWYSKVKQNDKNGRNLETVGFPISKKGLFWGSENQNQIVRDKIETKLTFLRIWNCPWQVENSEFRIRKKIKLIQPFKEIPEQRSGLLTHNASWQFISFQPS